MTFFVNLCILHDKTSVILDTYSNLVPSLVLCLTDVADRFWEEDEDFMNGPAEDYDACVPLHLSCPLEYTFLLILFRGMFI